MSRDSIWYSIAATWNYQNLGTENCQLLVSETCRPLQDDDHHLQCERRPWNSVYFKDNSLQCRQCSDSLIWQVIASTKSRSFSVPLVLIKTSTKFHLWREYRTEITFRFTFGLQNLEYDWVEIRWLLILVLIVSAKILLISHLRLLSALVE